MEGYSWKKVMWKKKFCAVLIVSLFIEGLSFLDGQSLLSVQAVAEGRAETESLEEETSIQESKEVEMDSATIDTPMEEDIPESSASKAGIFDQKGTESDAQREKDPNTEASEEDSSYTMLSGEKPSELGGITCLQIPEKLEIIIDPWEIDEREQIYSEPFTVKNTGDIPGTLMLSFICTLNEADGVRVKESQEGIRESEEKMLYMKVVLENGEESVFTREGAQCQIKLQPEEELSLWFEGEVNENAEEPWEDGDIEIRGIYSWEEEEIKPQEKKKDNLETESTVDYEETLPTEKEISVGEEPSLTEMEKETSEEEEASLVEADKETSEGKETQPMETDEEISEGEETQPIEMETETSIEESFPPAEMETEAVGKYEESTFPAETGKENTEEIGLSENRFEEVKERDG